MKNRKLKHMKKQTTKSHGYLKHFIINIGILLVLLNFPSLLMALDPNQKKAEESNVDMSLFKNSGMNIGYLINGADTIFKSSFEPVPVLILSANPTTVPSGGASALMWSISNSPTQCLKSGDWSGNMSKAEITNGGHQFTVSNITTSKTYGLICSNSSGQSPLRTAVVTVESGNPTCISQPPILNGAEDISILSNGTANADFYDGTYNGMTSGSGWPGNYGESIGLSLSQNKYVSAMFNTNGNDYDARLLFQVPSNFQGPPSNAYAVVISECPGDFNTHLNQAKCITNSNSLYWSTKKIPNGPPGFFCELEKNTVYYLNIVHSDNSENNDYATSDCQNSYCGLLFTQSKVNL